MGSPFLSFASPLANLKSATIGKEISELSYVVEFYAIHGYKWSLRTFAVTTITTSDTPSVKCAFLGRKFFLIHAVFYANFVGANTCAIARLARVVR